MPEQETNLLPEAVLPEVYAKQALAKTNRFIVGLKPGGPAWSQTFAGISFSVYTVRYSSPEDVTGTRMEGDIVELTSDQCKAIKESIRNRIVRWSHYGQSDKAKAGQRRSAQIWDVRTRGFMPMKGDEPLVNYVVFREAPPEFVQSAAPAAAFEALDKAILDATASELAARQDPADADTRKKHAEAKKAGKGLSDLGAL